VTVPWVNLDDQFPSHPKVAGLSDAAFRLHVSGICYSNRYLTDGLLDATVVPQLVPNYRRKTLAELVDRAMWLPLLDGAAYTIHDFLQWNRSRQQVQQYSQQQSDRAKKRWGT
jgi:hypothetical protein